MTSKEIEHLLLSDEGDLWPENWTTSEEKLRVLQIRATYQVAYQLAVANEKPDSLSLLAEHSDRLREIRDIIEKGIALRLSGH